MRDNSGRNVFVNKVQKLFLIICLAVFFIISIVMINYGLGFPSVLILIVLGVSMVLCYKYRERLIEFAKRHKKGVMVGGAILILFGLMLRLLLIPFLCNKINIEHVLSDTGTHWFGAQQLVNSGNLDEEIGEYESMFPYLFTYTSMLAATMKIIGINYASVVILNLVFDIIGMVGLFLLFRKWKGNKQSGLLAMFVWAINPLEIAFCALPLAIVAVNTMFIVTVLCIYYLYSSIGNFKKMCLYSVLFGIVLAIGNAFRPFFIIYVIALVIFFVLFSLKDRKKIKQSVVSIILVIVTMLLTGVFLGKIHTCFNPYYHGEKSQAGWSMFVGANYESHGKWNSNDRDYFFGRFLAEEAGGDLHEAQSMIVKEAALRYVDIVISGNLFTHIFNKTNVLFGDVKNAIYDLPYVFGISSNSVKYHYLQNLILAFYYVVFVLFGVSVYDSFKKFKGNTKRIDFIIILVIVFIGFFFSSLLVEVMNRYSLPFITLMSLFAISYISDRSSLR